MVSNIQDMNAPWDQNRRILVRDILCQGRVASVHRNRDKTGSLAMPAGQGKKLGQMLPSFNPHDKWRHGHATFLMKQRNQMNSGVDTRRLLRPFTPGELATHLRITDSYARRVLHGLVDKQQLVVASGHLRFRTYQLNIGNALWNMSGDRQMNERQTRRRRVTGSQAAKPEGDQT